MNHRLVKLLALVAALAAMLAFAGAVAAMPNDLEFSSDIRVQNIEGEPANVVISFYDLDGDGTPVHQLHDTIEGYGDRYYFTIQYPLGENWSGSAVVGADREIRVINNLYTEDWAYQGASSGYLSGAYEVGLPLIQLSNKDWDTWFNVQNVGPNPATVQVVFEPGLAGKSYTTEEVTLEPFVAYTFDQRDMTAQLLGPSPVSSDPDGQAFIGAATVYSDDSPVVATVVEGSTGQLMVYDGFIDLGTEDILVAPLYHTNHNTTVSSIHVQNRGDVATTVTVNYVPSTSVPDSGTACYETYTIEPGAMKVFGLYAFHPAWNINSPNSDCYTKNGMNRFVGSAYIDQDTGNSAHQLLVAEVQEFTPATGTGSAYNAIGPENAAPVLSFPEILDRNNGVWTSINLFNASDTDPEDITIYYHGRIDNGVGDVVTVTQTLTLQPLESTNILHAQSTSPFAFALGNGWVGSALLVADDGDARLVAVTNKLAPDAGDSLSTYNAFPIWDLPVEPTAD